MSTFNNLVSLTDGVRYEIFAPQSSAKDVVVQNVGSSNVYLGSSNVTAENYGLKLTPGLGFSVTLGFYDELYAITDGGDSEISVLTIGGK